MCKESHAIHPILSLLYSLLLFVTGLLFVKEIWFWLFFVTFLILFLLFRFEKIIIKTIPFILIFGLIMSGLTIINGNKSDVLYSFYRVLALGLASILSISVKPINLVRAFNQLHFPRWISLGFLIVIRFMQIFCEEIKQIRQAIVLRGIRFINTPVLWSRAFFIPLIIRVLSISEGLAISLETRGFATNIESSSYQIICFKRRDLIFSSLFLACLTFYIYWFAGGYR
ncbi:MAG: energy-coupling factor transporter transmembrane component T family protein [Saccharofermentanales bacterium]|jgi:energy-coupling factor transport system permease protein